MSHGLKYNILSLRFYISMVQIESIIKTLKEWYFWFQFAIKQTKYRTVIVVFFFIINQ